MNSTHKERRWAGIIFVTAFVVVLGGMCIYVLLVSVPADTVQVHLEVYPRPIIEKLIVAALGFGLGILGRRKSKCVTWHKPETREELLRQAHRLYGRHWAEDPIDGSNFDVAVHDAIDDLQRRFPDAPPPTQEGKGHAGEAGRA